MTLTICYLTNRKEPMLRWFMDSCNNQITDNHGLDLRFVIVSYHPLTEIPFTDKLPTPIIVKPKPCVWQGEHRLSKVDYFAASNARNTGLCLAPDGYICYVDDLSVAMPGWFNSVVEATKFDGVTLGAYRKVFEIRVESHTGVVTHFRDNPNSHDHRIQYNHPVACGGQWLYGCSLVAPVEKLLEVGGWPEALCDGMGYEDTTLGIMMQNAGTKFQYDARMMTWESEEHHYCEGNFMKRDDFGKSPFDKSHAMLSVSKQIKHHPNFFGEEGICGLRDRILKGEEFPIMKIPEHEWFTGKLIADL